MAYRSRAGRNRAMEFVSDGSRALLGVEPESLTSGRIAFGSLIHPADRERIGDEIQTAVASRGVFAFQYRLQHASDEWRAVWERGRAVFDDIGKGTVLEGYIADITPLLAAAREHRRAEFQAHHARKLKELNLLAATISHDFNNAVAGILGSAELIKMDLAPDHPGQEFLQQVFVAGERARLLVRQIRNLSLRKSPERSSVRLQPLVEECLRQLRTAIPDRVELSHAIDPGCPPVFADAEQIRQVIMDFCLNAAHALPDAGGHIKLTLESCAGDASAPPGVGVNPHVRLSIWDDGPNLTPAAQGKIFDPVFKEPVHKRGGLDFFLAQDVAAAHEGVITVQSEAHRGTTFCLLLPAQLEG
jgi:signal transduction histidine kinase